MKILVTGMTAQHIGSNRRQIKYEAVTDTFVKALRHGGDHQVDWRPVDPGEDLSGYDVVLVGVVPIGSLAATYIYGALYAIATAPNVHVFVDDWQFPSITSSLKTYTKAPDKLVKPLFNYRRDYDWAFSSSGRSVIDPVMARLVEKLPPVLVPAFNWGDRSKLDTLSAERMVYLDPSPFCHDYEASPYPREDRERAWVMGTLSDQRTWLESLQLGWEVSYVGGKASKAEMKVTEQELVEGYAQSWGVLSHPYRHAGSGWWRNRFVHAARTGSVLLGDKAEVTPIGESYELTGHAVEALSSWELEDLGQCQAAELSFWEISKDETYERITGYMKDAIK